MSAASIYAKRKTTNELSDSNFANQINSYRTSQSEAISVQREQMEQQQKQYQQIQLPQQRLMQGGKTMALQGQPTAAKRAPISNSSNSSSSSNSSNNSNGGHFSAFTNNSRSATGATQVERSATEARQIQQQQAIQRQRAEQQQLQQQSRLAKVNRFELFYSRSCEQSRKQAEHILERLEIYFPDAYIRQHMVAIDFDNPNTIGPVHEAILKTRDYLATIQVDCLLYDKFENSIIMPSQKVDLHTILKNYCRSMAPKSASPTPAEQQQQQKQQEREYNQIAEQQKQQTRQPATIALPPAPQPRRPQPTLDSDGNVVPMMPSRANVNFSALAKQFGADVNTPTAEVNLHAAVPARANALLLADTQAELDALPATDAATVYGKSRGVTLGFGEDMAAITKEFVERHNAGNPLERDISVPTQQQKGAGGGAKKLPQVNASLGRKADFQPQHLQGLQDAPFAVDHPSTAASPSAEEDESQYIKPQKQRRLPLPAEAPTALSSQKLNEHEQLGRIKQIKCKK